MRRVAAVLLLQVLLASLTVALPVPDLDVLQRVDRLEFKSCPGCRLNYQGQLRDFLHNRVATGQIPGVTVEFIQSHRPELHYIDAEGKTIGGVSVDRVGVKEVEDLLAELGF